MARIRRELTARQAAHLENVPAHYREALRKAYTAEASAKQAIRTKCYECVSWEGVVLAVRECTSPLCPLYAYRPNQAPVARKIAATGAKRGVFGRGKAS
jgi:hypothetical protein